MLKALSVIGYLAMVGGFIGLLVTRSVLSPSPLVIAPQVAALALMIWARLTFGRRSFHFAANPTAGGLVTTGPPICVLTERLRGDEVLPARPFT